MSDQDNDIKTARLEQLSMAELKAIHLAIFGEHVHRAQRRALVSRIRQAIGSSGGDLIDEHLQQKSVLSETPGCAAAGDAEGPEPGSVPKPESGGPEQEESASEESTSASSQVSIPLLARPLKDLCIAELQLRCLLMSGRPTRSRNRTYLERTIRKMETHGPVTPRPLSNTGLEGHECRNLSVRLPIRAMAQIDTLCRRLGISSRSAFLRQSMYRYLCELGETKIASMLASSL